jgi:hypothetical protein
LNVPSPMSGPSSSGVAAVSTPRLMVPATTVPTPGTPKTSSITISAGSRCALNHGVRCGSRP